MDRDELAFTYFPDNYRWSHGFLLALGAAPWGGGEIGEINRVGLRLAATRSGDDRAWFEEWTRMAERVETVGRERAASGKAASAAAYLFRAAHYYHVGERFLQSEVGRRARRLQARRRLLPRWSAPRAPAAHRARRGALRGHEPAGALRSCRGWRAAVAGPRLLRRLRRHEGDPVLQGRPRPRRARHRLPDRRRTRQRRGHPLQEPAAPPRDRAVRDRGLRVPRRAAGGRCRRRRRDGDQPGRLLRAPRRRVRVALRRLHRVGSAVGLPRGLEGAAGSDRARRDALAVRALGAPALDFRRDHAGRGAEAAEQ